MNTVKLTKMLGANINVNEKLLSNKTIFVKGQLLYEHKN